MSKEEEINTVYINTGYKNQRGEPNGTIERPYPTLEEAIYSLSGDVDPEPHDLVFPPNIKFASMDFGKGKNCLNL